MPIAQLNDINLFYKLEGSGDPLVLISGFGADHSIWNSIVSRLADTYTVLTFDNRGVGQSDVPSEKYSIEQMAKDTVALMQFLHIDRAAILGHSMGGYIAQTVAHQFPSFTKSLILSNTAMATETCFHFFIKAYFELLKNGTPAELCAKLMSPWGFSYQYLEKPMMIDGLAKYAANNPHPTSLTGYLGQFAAIGDFSSKTWAKEINSNTLVMSSDQDLILDQRHTKALAHEIKDSQYFCFKDCGHMPYIEQPQKFVTQALSFLTL